MLSRLIAQIKTIRTVSAPVVVFVISLTLLTVAIFMLWRSGLLPKLLATTALQFATIVLAVLAILFGSIQFWDSRRHGSRIEHLTKSMSTRYIGMFPKDMDDIIEVIRLADRDLLIVCDFIDYGSYSRPKTHQLLFDELKKARERGVEVRCLVYDDKLAQKILLNQFKEPEFQQTCRSNEFKQYFEYWSGIQHDADDGFNHAAFLEILTKKQKKFETDLLDQGVQIQTLSEKAILFFWMQDKLDAVFSFVDIGSDDAGLAFRTRDAKLVETFAALFNRLATGPPINQADVAPAELATPGQLSGQQVIRFTKSPLETGWGLAGESNSSQIKFSFPSANPGGLELAADSTQAIDYAAPEQLRGCSRIRFRAKLTRDAHVYAKVELVSSSGGSRVIGWIACSVGDKVAQKVANNEWLISRPQLPDGWALFDLSIPDEINRSHFRKEQSLEFSGFLGIRLRGSLAVSPIELLLQ